MKVKTPVKNSAEHQAHFLLSDFKVASLVLMTDQVRIQVEVCCKSTGRFCHRMRRSTNLSYSVVLIIGPFVQWVSKNHIVDSFN